MADGNHADRLLADATWLSRVAQSLVADPATGEDLAQETWLAALHGGPDGGDSPGRGWLRTTLRSRLWNRRRQEDCRRSIESDGARSERVASAAELVERAELQERLATALIELSEPVRTTALLRFLDGLSTNEIGARTGAPADTVRNRLRRAAEILRTKLCEGDQSALVPLAPAPLFLKSARGNLIPAFKSLGAKACSVSVQGTIGGVLMTKLYVAIVGFAVVGLAFYVGEYSDPLPPDATRSGDEIAGDEDVLDLGVAEDVERSRSAATTTTNLDQIGAVEGDRDGLVIRVVTKQGLPVDHFGVSARLAESSNSDVESLWSRTDDTGTVEFSREDVERVQAQRPTEPLKVGHHGTMHDPVVVELAPGIIPDEPVAIEVDMMRLVVDAVEPDGTRWTKRHGLSVSPIDYHYSSIRGEPPLIGWVPRKTGYEARVYDLGLYTDVETEFPAPGPEEVERRHTLELGPVCPGVRGIAQFADGTLVPEESVLRIVDRTRNGNGSRLAIVQRGGRFEYPLRLGEGTGQARVFRFAVAREGHMHGIGATVAFEVPEKGQWLDLGTIVLETRPVLAKGRLVVPDGMTMRSLGVDVRVLQKDEILRRAEWKRHPELDNCVFVKDDGSFMVFGEDLPGPERLGLVTGFRDDADGLVPACSLDIVPGESELQVPLVRPGAVRATIDLTGTPFQRTA